MSKTTSPGPGILRNIRVKRVALVEMGANYDRATGDGAHIMLYKSAPSVDGVHVAVPMGGESEEDRRKRERKNKEKSVATNFIEWAKGIVKTIMEPDAAKREVAATELLASAEELMKMFPPTPAMPGAPIATPVGAAPAAPAAAPAVSPEHQAAMKAHQDQLAKAMAACGPGPFPPDHQVHAMKSMHDQITKMLAACGGAPAPAAPAAPVATPNPVAPMKSAQEEQMSAELEKRATDLEKANTDLKAQLEKQAADMTAMKADIEKKADADNTRETRDVLKSFKATPFKLEGEGNDVEKYAKLRKSDPDTFKAIMDTFRKQDNQIAESALYKNVGSGLKGGGGTAWNRIEELAKARKLEMAKSSVPISMEKAVDDIMQENPDLFQQYRAEQASAQ